MLISEYFMDFNLRVVRIYFDTTTFDRITKDSAAKFVDMWSTIGGTLGLLTGFSIISGVEILYFGLKLSWICYKKALAQKDQIIKKEKKKNSENDNL